jgi:multicomponent Na+:H+ antiporter subunit E
MSAPPPASRRLWALQTAALLLVIWLALDGLDNVAVGLVVAILGAAIGAWLVPGEPYPWRPLRLARFFTYFVRESLRGGIDVAWRALHPRMPIAPRIVEHRTRLPPGLPRAVMVGVISLLPGTLSVTLGEDGRLNVHALTPGAADGLAELDRRVGLLFSLDSDGKAQ